MGKLFEARERAALYAVARRYEKASQRTGPALYTFFRRVTGNDVQYSEAEIKDHLQRHAAQLRIAAKH